MTKYSHDRTWNKVSDVICVRLFSHGNLCSFGTKKTNPGRMLLFGTRFFYLVPSSSCRRSILQRYFLRFLYSASLDCTSSIYGHNPGASLFAHGGNGETCPWVMSVGFIACAQHGR